MVGEVQYTDSQKSISTMSNFYSHDFTDSCSDKNASSGKETYVIEWDSSEDSDKPPFPLHEKKSILNLHSDRTLQFGSHVSRSTSTSFHKCTIVAEETFTQTSKTIMELAENDDSTRNTSKRNSSETQTSFVSVIENKTIEYTIQVSSSGNNYTKNEIATDAIQKKPTFLNISYNKILPISIEDDSSKYPGSETDRRTDSLPEDKSTSSGNEQTIKIIDEDCKEIVPSDETCGGQCEDNSDFESDVVSDMEEDSLMDITDKTKKNHKINNDVKELRSKLAVKVDVHMPERFAEPDIRRFGILTPLTEESNLKKDSLMDITPNVDNISNFVEEPEDRSDVAFTSNTGMKIKHFRDDNNQRKEALKLPPIKNNSCPNSPHTSSMAHLNMGNNAIKTCGFPYIKEGHRQRDSMFDRWELGTKDLAAGESVLISDRSGKKNNSN